MSDEQPGTSTAPSEDTKPVKPMPPWRRRLYRVPVLGTVAYVVWPPRTKAPSIYRRAVSWVLAVIAVLGIGMAAYPIAGQFYPFFLKVPVEKLIAWSNFLSDMESNRIQGDLEDRFLALADPRDAGEGDPLTRLEIPDIGVDTIVVQGTSPTALKAGAGHYPSTPLPGEKGNVGIAGHRTTYGRPFNKVNSLDPGDRIILTTPVGRYTYEVSKAPWITNPYDWSVVAPSDEPLLTLTSCHPLGSARERIVVRAHLVKSEPLQAKAA